MRNQPSAKRWDTICRSTSGFFVECAMWVEGRAVTQPFGLMKLNPARDQFDVQGYDKGSCDTVYSGRKLTIPIVCAMALPG